MNNYCLKYDQQKQNLILVECYYCVVYNFDKCVFTYKYTDNKGMLFYYEKYHKDEFYLKSTSTSISNKISYSKNNSTIQLVSSYLSDEVDFSTELLDIKANSTISSDYPVRNILYDNLDYWSSNFTRDDGCSGASIIISLRHIIVVKTISIKWVKPPYLVRIYLCENDNCVFLQKLDDFSSFLSLVSNIYIKANKIKIEMEFDRSRLRDYNYQCFCSISELTVSKNEIELKSLEGDAEKLSEEGIESSENFNTLNSPTKKIYSDNFFLTKIENIQTINFDTSDFEKMYSDSQHYVKEIENNYLNIKKKFIGPTSDFAQLLSNLTYTNGEYHRKVVKELNRIKRYEYLLSEVKGSSKRTQQVINKNQTVKNNKKISPKKSQYLALLSQFINVKNYFENLPILKNKMVKNFKSSTENLISLITDLNNFLVRNATIYTQAYSDKFVKDAIDSSEKIKSTLSALNIYDKISKMNPDLQYVEEGLESLKHITKSQLREKLNFLGNEYQAILKIKQKELSGFLKNFELLLQNIKLIKMQIEEIFLSIQNKCLPVQLVTNSYYDNFFVKLVINFKRETINDYNIFIFKFFNKDVFYYIRYNAFKIEVWRKKYEQEKKLFTYNKCTSEYDKFNQVDNFSKLFYVLIKVENGKFSLLLKIDYHQIPSVIEKYLEGLNNINYEKLMEIYEQNENDFKEYYGDAKLIYEKNDVDLFLGGNMAFYSPKNNTKILMVAAYPKKNSNEKDKNQISSLNSKYPYNFFQTALELPNNKMDSKIIEILSLDRTWKSYDTQFQVLTNFYLKFEIDIDRLYGEDMNYAINDSDSNSSIREEQQNSVYLILQSMRAKSSYFIEIVKVENGFLWKLFLINNNSGKRINIFRKRFDVDKKIKKRNFAVILVKNSESLMIEIKLKSHVLFKNVFTIKDFSFIKFMFLMNPRNSGSVTNVYLSDTYSGNFVKKENFSKKKIDEINSLSGIKYECSVEIFETYKCIVDDKKVCKTLFCKSCCSKKLKKKNPYQYEGCFAKCHEGLKDKLEKLNRK
jgi:hypothetical protein